MVKAECRERTDTWGCKCPTAGFSLDLPVSSQNTRQVPASPWGGKSSGYRKGINPRPCPHGTKATNTVPHSTAPTAACSSWGKGAGKNYSPLSRARNLLGPRTSGGLGVDPVPQKIQVQRFDSPVTSSRLRVPGFSPADSANQVENSSFTFPAAASHTRTANPVFNPQRVESGCESPGGKG